MIRRIVKRTNLEDVTTNSDIVSLTWMVLCLFVLTRDMRALVFRLHVLALCPVYLHLEHARFFFTVCVQFGCTFCVGNHRIIDHR